jgi:outer membrane protein assembly factor BamB
VLAGQKLFYTLVSGPSHGKVTLPTTRLENSSFPAMAVYTSDRDFIGNDSFTWKAGDGVTDSAPARASLVVTAAVPIPEAQTGFVVKDSATDIPAAFTGGGGYEYVIKPGLPAYGTVSLSGTTFRYTPRSGYTGSDSFTWAMKYSKDAATVAATSPSGTCWIVVKPAGMTDWPQWRADEWRSGFTTMRLPAVMHLQWRRNLPTATGAFGGPGSRIYPDIDFCRPVQFGKTLFVPVAASDCLAAYHTDTGEQRWKFYASGAVRRPPAISSLADGSAVAIFGSDDGWVYALNAADGSVRWKFRAAPNDRKVIGFGRLSSVWPIWGSPVISEGKVYFVAGYIPSCGLYGYCLDAATGAVLWENDGRISDMWNTSAFGPLALSHDRTQIYGSVEGAATPWMLDASTGEFLGHRGVGFGYPGGKHGVGYGLLTRSGACGWYVDGKGAYNIPEPMTITAGSQTITVSDMAALGVTGTVASLLAGDGKLFVVTAASRQILPGERALSPAENEGTIYCFGSAQVKPAIIANATNELPVVTDGWTSAAQAMLSRKDLKEGLALVLGITNGRLVEELARQSSLMVVAVGADAGKLQKLRAKMDAAGFPAARVSTLEGSPMDFGFSPYQATLIVSEDVNLVGAVNTEALIAKLYTCTRPFGGEIWLPTTDVQDTKIKNLIAGTTNMPLAVFARQKFPGVAGDGFTQIKRTGLPDDKLRLQPPFGPVAFGVAGTLANWSPIKSTGPGYLPPPPPYDSKNPGFPTVVTVTTPDSIFTSLVNPLFTLREQFVGLPSSGNDSACSGSKVPPNRYGDMGLSHGKLASIFDASSRYWGRFFLPELGGCPGGITAGNGVVSIPGNPVPGNTCGCSAAMQFTEVAFVPMANEENWVAYQSLRTSRPVEDLPIRRIGINFGAPGDRYLPEEGLLWTHHPHAGRYGRFSYNANATPEAMPLVPVSYQGRVVSVYHHSAQMKLTNEQALGWVAASYVKNMTEIEIPLAQPAVARLASSTPIVDGKLDDPCWDGQQQLVFVANPAAMDPNRSFGQPRPDDACFAMVRYDDKQLYVAAGAHARYAPGAKKFLTVTLNSRERVVDDVVLTCEEKSRKSTGIGVNDWSGACLTTGAVAFTAEIAVPWKSLAAAGLWKEQLILNVNVSASPLAAQFVPLFLDEARGAVAEMRPYTVRLHFAEMEGKGTEQRIFDVSLQEKPVLRRLDVAKESGGPKRELVKVFSSVGIVDKLKIGFAAQAGEPMLSGVEIIGTYPVNDPTPNKPPEARIEASAISGPAPLDVILDAQKSHDPDGQIVECAWETGDGRLARGSRLNHVYAEPGTYLVKLLVRDDRGARKAANLTVTVTAGSPAAFVCEIREKGGDYATLSAWETAMRSDLTATTNSRLFQVMDRGQYAPADDNGAVTFTGGGMGKLRHINGTHIAFVTDCTGTIQPGAATCASGNRFTVADSGHPVCTLVAECHDYRPDGNLADRVVAGAVWKTDAIRCVIIRAAAGQGRAGFVLKGDLDLTELPFTRVVRLTVDPGGTLAMGIGGSIDRVMAGAVTVRGGGMVANSVGTAFSVAGLPGVTNFHASVYHIDRREGGLPRGMQPPAVYGPGSYVHFYNCSASTFDPGNQPHVAFVNCVVTPGGKGFVDARYAYDAVASQCTLQDGTATRWESGGDTE